MLPHFAHILICRTDNIGDVVLTLPLAGYLKQQFPGARVELLCREYAAPAARLCAHLDQVHTLEGIGDPDAWFAAAGIDTVIFAFPRRALARAAWRAGVARRVGTSHRLYHWLYCNGLAHFSRARSPLHEAQLNFALLRPLGLDYSPPLAALPALFGLTAPAGAAPAGAIGPGHAGAAAYHLIVHPKSNGNGREWPLAHYTELARRLQARTDIRLWLTGSAAEGQLLAQQAPDLLALPNVDNLCGRFDLAGLAGLIAASDGLLASGTGPLHLSAALGRPTLGLFPRHQPVNAARWGALGQRAQSLTATAACPACRGSAACNCMDSISPAAVEQILLGWCAPQPAPAPAPAQDAAAGRILVISPNWIGDAVMAQPLLQRLRAAWPDSPIDVLAPPSVAPVWRQMAEVDELLETPFRHGALQLRERWRYARVLRQRGYRQAYVLPNTLKFALLPWLAGIARRVGYKGESRYGLINVMHHDDSPPRPMVAFYAALAKAPCAPLAASQPRPALQVSAAQIAAINGRCGLDPLRPLVVFAPGAEFGGAKRWPAEHFGALARAILARDGQTQIALLGSPKDREVCEQVSAAAAAPGALHNLAGSTSLAEAIALIARSAAVVANDSGLLHIASALNRPVLALYGPTDPDHAPPFSDLAASISLRLECAPCRQRECPLGHQNCMRQIDSAMVWRRLEPMLAAGQPA